MTHELAQYIEDVCRTFPTLKSYQERALLTKAKAGEQSARDKLVAAYIRKTILWLDRLEEVDMDIVQEANLAVIVSIDSFIKGNANPSFLSFTIHNRVKRSIDSWLKNKASIFCIKRVRKGSSKQLSVEFMPVCDIAESYWFQPPDEVVVIWLVKEELEKCLKMLKEQEQQFIYMKYFQNMTNSQIRDRLELTTEQVQNIEQRTMRRLRHPSISRHLKDYVH